MDIQVPDSRIHRDAELAKLTKNYPIEKVFGGIYHSIRTAGFISAAGLVYEKELLYFFGHPIQELSPKQNYKLVGVFGELAISAAKRDEWIGLRNLGMDYFDFLSGCQSCVPYLDYAIREGYIRIGIDQKKRVEIGDSIAYVAPQKKLVELISEKAKSASPLLLTSGQ